MKSTSLKLSREVSTKNRRFESCQLTACADTMRLSGDEEPGGEAGKKTGREGEGDFCALYTHAMDTDLGDTAI